MTLAEFLLARIGEDERLATDAARYVGGSFGQYNIGAQAHVVRELWDHADHWTPARVLAECEAKRRIVELHPVGEHPCPGKPVEWIGYRGGEQFADWWCRTLCLLALPYSSHPDYDEAWKP